MPPFQPRQSFLRFRKHLENARGVDLDRLRVTANGVEKKGGEFVLYWAQSARRLESNAALNFAISEANRRKLPVVVYESLRPDYPAANDRIHSFALQGVADNIRSAKTRGLRYAFFLPRRREEARGMLRGLAARSALTVTDEFPTFILRDQTERFARGANFPLAIYDGNGLLPMRAFEKEQYSARFLRDRTHRMLEDFWRDIEPAKPLSRPFEGELPFEAWDGSDPSAAAAGCDIDHSVSPVSASGGRAEGLRVLERFVTERLSGYAARRTREVNRSSELSPYLHFGFVSIHEVAHRVLFSDCPTIDIDAFLEEAVVRRELSFNFCHFRRDHDSLQSLPDWARATLAKHAGDRRHPAYSLEEMETASTGDEVWNLSQRGLLTLGTIHNYLRMLWGKRIIEWSETPEDAHRVMMYLHDKYAIDGRDPNTHAGVLWCFGKHDRPWAPERPVFGSIRYMSSEATRRKVDLAAYAEKIAGAEDPVTRSLFP